MGRRAKVKRWGQVTQGQGPQWGLDFILSGGVCQPVLSRGQLKAENDNCQLFTGECSLCPSACGDSACGRLCAASAFLGAGLGRRPAGGPAPIAASCGE